MATRAKIRRKVKKVLYRDKNVFKVFSKTTTYKTQVDLGMIKY